MIEYIRSIFEIIITQLTNIEVYFEIARKLSELFTLNSVNKLIDSSELSKVLATISMIFLLPIYEGITYAIALLLAMLNIFNLFIFFIMPLAFIGRFKKVKIKKWKLCIPFYNVFIMSNLSGTSNLLYFIILLSMFCNKPFTNILIPLLSENSILNNEVFIILAGLIFGIFGLIFHISLFYNTKEYLEPGYKTKKCPSCDNKIKRDTKICSVCGIPLNNNNFYINSKETEQITEKIKTPNISKQIQNITPITLPKKEETIDPTLAVYQEHEKPVITEKPKKKCPKCGAGNGLEAKYCMICNAKLKKK